MAQGARQLRTAIDDEEEVTYVRRGAAVELVLASGPDIPPPTSAPPVDAPPQGHVALLRREGEYWTLVYADATSRLRDTKGLHYLSRLLRHPGQEFHVLDLIRIHTPEVGGRLGQGLDILDPQAKAAYRRRLAELRAEVEEAEGFHDLGRTERARSELEAIDEQLAAAVGLGGRDRKVGSASERARAAVTQRLRAAIRRIAGPHPALADHLAGRIKTGTFCVYRPDPIRPIAWDLG